VYADFASGRIWALTTDRVTPATNALLLDSPHQISSFGVDRQNELYVLAYGAGKVYRLTGPATAVEPPSVPVAFGLDQNYPNPFNPSTEIAYRVPGSGPVRVSVHDLLGREIAVLVDEAKSPGTHEVTFDASGLPSGVYLCRLSAGGRSEARRMLLVK
jgi:hypothetical protein